MDSLEVEMVHFYPLENAEEHHTKRFEVLHDDLPRATIVRRGQPFKGVIKFVNRTFDSNLDVVQFVFSIGDNPGIGTQGSVFMKYDPEEDERAWHVKITDEQNDVVQFEVFTPINLPVGNWVLQVVTRLKNGNSRRIYHFQEDIYILFNPWNEADQTYMEESILLDEYVQSDVGKIYVGTVKTTKGRQWIYGQFDSIVLPASLFMLDRASLPFEHRGDPVKVARAISRITNSNDDDGVIYGGWSGEYDDGTAPSAWTGSVEILKQYLETMTAVRYGQCWVFAGVVTSACRALGIPSRVVTNFESAHDINESLTLDKYYSETMEELSSEGIWNFHVWNDVWMARPDLPQGYGGWQAIDATPQEPSSGVYQCGPASVEAVKQGVLGLAYDVPFMLASVNADLVRWKKDPDAEDGYSKIDTNKYHIGQLILTKKPLILDPMGDTDKEDITSLYKFDEGSEAERLTLYNAVRQSKSKNAQKSYAMNGEMQNDVMFELVDMEGVNMGEDFVVVIKIANDSNETRTVKTVLRAQSLFYNGVRAQVLKESDGGITVGPGGHEELAIMVEAAEYLEKLVERCHVKVSAIASVLETKQTWADDDVFQIIKPNIVIKFNEDLIQNRRARALLSFTNPLSITLSDCEFRLGGNGIQTFKTRIGNVGPNMLASGEISVAFNRSGLVNLVATFDSKQLRDISGEMSVQVLEG